MGGSRQMEFRETAAEVGRAVDPFGWLEDTLKDTAISLSKEEQEALHLNAALLTVVAVDTTMAAEEGADTSVTSPLTT